MFQTVDPGTKVFRSRKHLNYTHNRDCDYGLAYPMFTQFILPGDVIKLTTRLFIRYQPTLAPILNGCKARMRFFYVNLRQIEPDFETIVTGSLQGQSVADLPVMHNFVEDVKINENFVVSKGTFWDCLGIPCLDYKAIKTDKCLPSRYWYKGYKKIEWDFYREENIDTGKDFEEWFEDNYSEIGGQAPLFSVNLKKDYFTSATPFEMKGTIPTFDVEVTEPFDTDGYTENFMFARKGVDTYGERPLYNYLIKGMSTGPQPAYFSSETALNNTTRTDIQADFPGIPAGKNTEADGSSVPFKIGVPGSELNEIWNGFSGSFNMRDIRRMSALTRIKERDMRCGSRYTEYLRANFHTAPADETLQRPVYLGGFVQPIITNEVLQTANDEDYPVGTLRGKGISDGANTIRNFISKEFGLLYGILDIVPDILYTQGVDRQLTYKSRYDFFNPSFQNLSEQEVRNGEIFISNSDGLNDETFGFQGMYNELRSRRNIVTGDLRDSLKYWTQAIEFASRPNWGENFLKAYNYQSSFKRPFAVADTAPMIVDCDNIVDIYRPMISEPVPGLVDHN